MRRLCVATPSSKLQDLRRREAEYRVNPVFTAIARTNFWSVYILSKLKKQPSIVIKSVSSIGRPCANLSAQAKSPTRPPVTPRDGRAQRDKQNKAQLHLSYNTRPPNGPQPCSPPNLAHDAKRRRVKLPPLAGKQVQVTQQESSCVLPSPAGTESVYVRQWVDSRCFRRDKETVARFAVLVISSSVATG